MKARLRRRNAVEVEHNTRIPDEVSIRAFFFSKKKNANHFWLCQRGSQLTNIWLGWMVGIFEALGAIKMKADLFKN